MHDPNEPDSKGPPDKSINEYIDCKSNLTEDEKKYWKEKFKEDVNE